MKLAETTVCTGCGACKAACPKAAIEFRDDAAGFPYPEVRTESCVDCGACERVCPALHPPKAEPIRAAYAAQIKDDAEALKKSTSGALFTVFSREILGRGGVVYGCVWSETCEAVIVRAETEAEIAPMRGSKYVWSSAVGAYPSVRADLAAGLYVLFVGLPCQVAGLKNYLGKDCERLTTLDFLCSGAPSPMALDRWLDTFCTKEQRKTLDLKFRDKEPYGVGVHITWNGQKKLPPKKAQHLRDPYYYSFYTRLIDRDSCYVCPYGGGERAADLTVGDYWGLAKYHPEMKNAGGVSALLVNSENGAALLAAVRPRLNLTESKPEYIAAENNLYVGNKRMNRVRPAERDAFFGVLREQGWAAAEKRFLHTPGRSLRILRELLPPKAAAFVRKLTK